MGRSCEAPPPVVSVVIPAHDRPLMLQRAVRSVLSQTHAELELVVVDDGSSQDLGATRELVEAAGHRFLRTPRRGPAAARNRGAAQTSGRWIAFLDSDDVWLEEKLEAQVECLNVSGYRVCQVEELWLRRGRQVKPGDRYRWREGDIFAASTEAVCVSTSSVMMERSLLEELGGFDERFFVCEDYDLWLRASLRERFGLVRRALAVKHAGHDDQLSHAVPAMDRFRLLSLVRLLVHQQLTPAQLRVAMAAAGSKLEILRKGAAKRGRSEAVDLYARIAARLEAGQPAEALPMVEAQAELSLADAVTAVPRS